MKSIIKTLTVICLGLLGLAMTGCELETVVTIFETGSCFVDSTYCNLPCDPYYYSGCF